MKKFFLKLLKILALILAVASTLALLFLVYFNWPVKLPSEKVPLGVTFSYRYAQDIGLDWQKAYLATIDDLQVKKIRIPVYWDWIEKKEGEYDFADLDWQLDQARQRGVEVILAIGQKVPRWPECFVPEWAGNDDAKRKESLLKLLEVIVNRYKNHSAVAIWQVENEPFLDFGICPEFDSDLLDEEIETVKKNDSQKGIMVTDSGELSIWLRAAKRGDYFGTTMYREVYTNRFGFWKYPIGPNFFRFKKALVSMIVGQDDFVVIELQGEPWLKGWTTNFSLEEQLESMNAQKLKENIEFAQKTKMAEIYVWGVEWWYWLKENQNYPEVWEQAKKLYQL